MIYIKKYGDFDSLNEEIYIAYKNQLRDAIHSVIVKELDYGESMKIDELSLKLETEHNINISSDVLKEILFEKWWKRNDFTIFKKSDRKWLDVWPYRDEVERKKVRNISPFGKGRRKIENKEKYGKNYSQYYKKWGYDYYD